MAKVEELEKSCKTLTDENKVLSENYNSERVCSNMFLFAIVSLLRSV